MLLSDREILKELENGNIVIEPFNPTQLGPNSYDMRLGHSFYYGDRSELSHLDPWDEKSVKRYWVLKTADESIIIPPGETVLGHTLEFAGGRVSCTAYLRARSSLVRSGIDVCKSAGMGDVGYINRWTMEISNFSNLPVILHPERRIAQLLFFRVGPTDKQYEGKYNIGDFEKWKPTMMLPRLWEDWDITNVHRKMKLDEPVVRRLVSEKNGIGERRE